MLAREDLDKLPMGFLHQLQVTTVLSIQDWGLNLEGHDLSSMEAKKAFLDRRDKLIEHLELLNEAIREPRARSDRVLFDDVTAPWE